MATDSKKVKRATANDIHHFVEAIPYQWPEKPHMNDKPEASEIPDPVGDAYADMVVATGNFLAIKQWHDCKCNPEFVGPAAQYHSEWVRDQLTKDDGTDFMVGVSEQVQQQIDRMIEVEEAAHSFLKFFIVKRITQEEDAPKVSFSDAQFWAAQIQDLRGTTELAFDIAARMAQIWEVEYKQHV